MGVGYYWHVPVRWLQERRGGHVGSVPTQVATEGNVIWQVYGAIVVTPGQYLPTPLVTREVVKFVRTVLAATDDEDEALGLGERLVYVGPSELMNNSRKRNVLVEAAVKRAFLARLPAARQPSTAMRTVSSRGTVSGSTS